MKKPFKFSAIVILLLIFFSKAWSQAPNITYPQSTYRFTPNNTITAITPTNSGGSLVANGYGTNVTFNTVATPYSVANDAAGNVYAADEGDGYIYKISPDGSTRTRILTNLNAPTAISIDGNGLIYISTTGNGQVRKYNATATTLLATITGFTAPNGIAFDAANNAYVADLGNGNANQGSIVKIDAATGTKTTVFTNLTNPYGIAIDPSGNYFISQYSTNSIVEITAGGVKSNFITTGLNGPREMTCDASGNIYVADFGNNRIKEYSPTGTLTTLAFTGLSSPRDVSIDASGNIFVADYGNDRIRELPATFYTISATLPTGLSFDAITGTISGRPASSFASTEYTVSASNASGTSSFMLTLSCGQTVDWVGGGGANGVKWERGNNWRNGTAPSPGDDVNIGVNYNVSGQPTISSTTGSVSVNSITFGRRSNPITLTVGNNGTSLSLTVNGDITVNTNSTATITSGGTGTSVESVIMSPGSTVNVNSTGAKLTISTDQFTLKSDITGSASIGPVTATNFITSGTTVNVERYLLGGLGYRGYMLLSSPVNTGTPDSHGNNIYSIKYLLNSVYTSGTGASFNTSTSKPGNPSMYLFRENMIPQYTTFLNSCFRGIEDMTADPDYTINLDRGTFNIPVGNGYLFYLRGGISSTDPTVAYTVGSTPGDATLTATGTLNQGAITFRHWFTPTTAGLMYSTISGQAIIEGFNLVGNPYACTIDLGTYATGGISMTNLSPFVYELDPITKNYGLYTLDGSAPASNHASRYIASGQGFFVVASSATPTPSLTFNESCKVVSVQNTGSDLLLSKAPVVNMVPRYLRLRMSLDSSNLDETIISFKNDAKTTYSLSEDALYHVGSGKVNIASFSSDHKMVTLNAMPLDKADTVKLKINAAADGIYTLNMNSIKGIPELYDIWLMDAYKKDSVDLRHNTSYSFNIIKADTASFGAYRFTLIMRQNPARGYSLLNFTATKTPGRRVQLNWETENEANYTNFTVERSTNGGATYAVVGGVPSTGSGKYGLLDKNPGENNLYRLKQEDINNQITYSNIVRVGFANHGNNLAGNVNIYPNPANNTVYIAVNTEANDKAAFYRFTITNNYGFIVRQGTSAQANWQANISGLQPGTYIIQVVNNKDRSFVGKSKLVKL